MQTENSTQKPFGFIYKLTNKINGKCYVGQAVNIQRRFAKYKSLDCLTQPKLYNALKKYGVSNFLFDVIDESLCQDHLNELETKHIVSLNSMDGGYNCNLGGGKMVGYKHSKESKKKISEANKGKHHIKHSQETKEKMSTSQKGKRTGKDAYWFGKTFSQETKQKLSDLWRGRTHSTETKLKMAESRRLYWEKRRQDATVNLTPFTSTDNGASSSIPS